MHLRPPRSERGRLLLTLHPEIGCQGWTRTNTVRFNKPSCYFDTTWQFAIGAAGKTRTCISSFRRRTPLYLGHGSVWKWSARQDLHLRSLGPRPSVLAATLRAADSGGSQRRSGITQKLQPWKRSCGKFVKNLALPVGLAPTLFPQTTGCFSIQLRKQINHRSQNARHAVFFHSALCIPNSALNLGGAGNAPVVTSDSYF